MAERVTEQLGTRPRTRYPWETWADGSTWLIKRGEDYAVADSVFQQMACQWGVRHGYVTSTKRHEDGVLVNFTPRPKKKLRPPKNLRK
jgi:hypothetical protein